MPTGCLELPVPHVCRRGVQMASSSSGALRAPPKDQKWYIESTLGLHGQFLGYKILSPTPSRKRLLDKTENRDPGCVMDNLGSLVNR